MVNDTIKPKIAILHYAGPPVVGGVESTIFHHVRLFTRAGYPVEVIAGRGESVHPPASFNHIPEVDSRNEEVVEIGDQLARGRVTDQFFSLRDRLRERLRPILSADDVTIVHNVLTLHKNLPLTAALRCLLDEGLTSWIAWCHDFAWQDPLYRPSLYPGYPWELLKEPWPGVRYVTVSESRRENLARLLGLPKDQIRAISPGIDVARFYKLEPLTQQLIEKLDLLQAGPVFLLPARITRRKNIEYAIRVLATVRSKLPEAQLIITGPPGPHNPKNIAYLSRLKDLADELQVDQQVHFLYECGEDGHPLFIPDEVIADLYRLADLLIFPSRREGFGIPVLEAALARLPVFATDIPPIQESAGELFYSFDPDGDPSEAGASILSFLEADRSYQLRRRVLQKYSWQNILEKDLIPLIEKSKNYEYKAN